MGVEAWIGGRRIFSLSTCTRQTPQLSLSSGGGGNRADIGGWQKCVGVLEMIGNLMRNDNG
jgi:hypothetical protein